jgi:hypothetical protein
MKAPLLAGRIATGTFAAALMVSGLVPAARADNGLPASASAVRNAIVAMSLADAAMPFALAVSTAGRDDRPVVLPASSAALKPETSAAMASMKPASARSANATYETTAFYDRRVRPYRDPFLLILGVAY